MKHSRYTLFICALLCVNNPLLASPQSAQHPFPNAVQRSWKDRFRSPAKNAAKVLKNIAKDEKTAQIYSEAQARKKPSLFMKNFRGGAAWEKYRDELEANVTRLDNDIKNLKDQYDRFFRQKATKPGATTLEDAQLRSIIVLSDDLHKRRQQLFKEHYKAAQKVGYKPEAPQATMPARGSSSHLTRSRVASPAPVVRPSAQYSPNTAAPKKSAPSLSLKEQVKKAAFLEKHAKYMAPLLLSSEEKDTKLVRLHQNVDYLVGANAHPKVLEIAHSAVKATGGDFRLMKEKLNGKLINAHTWGTLDDTTFHSPGQVLLRLRDFYAEGLRTQ